MRAFPRNGSVNEASIMAKAEAKRARKAAKRRRDAERTEEGKRNDLWWAMYDHAIEQSREVVP